MTKQQNKYISNVPFNYRFINFDVKTEFNGPMYPTFYIERNKALLSIVNSYFKPISKFLENNPNEIKKKV